MEPRGNRTRRFNVEATKHNKFTHTRLLELGCGTSAMGRKLRDEYDVVLTDNVDIIDDVIFADMLNLPAFFTDRFDDSFININILLFFGTGFRINQ